MVPIIVPIAVITIVPATVPVVQDKKITAEADGTKSLLSQEFITAQQLSAAAQATPLLAIRHLPKDHAQGYSQLLWINAGEGLISLAHKLISGADFVNNEQG